MIKIKSREIAEVRSRILNEQHNFCALCQGEILDDAVLDHDHKTGEIRGVLHRGCNALLGKIENNMRINRVDLGRLSAIAQNLIKYLTADGSGLMHPKHKEPSMGRGRGKGKRPPKR